MILCGTERIGAEHLPLEITSGRAPEAGSSANARAADLTLAQIERAHICKVLADAKGNKTRAASILGISRDRLRKDAQADGPARRAPGVSRLMSGDGFAISRPLVSSGHPRARRAGPSVRASFRSLLVLAPALRRLRSTVRPPIPTVRPMVDDRSARRGHHAHMGLVAIAVRDLKTLD